MEEETATSTGQLSLLRDLLGHFHRNQDTVEGMTMADDATEVGLADLVHQMAFAHIKDCMDTNRDVPNWIAQALMETGEFRRRLHQVSNAETLREPQQTSRQTTTRIPTSHHSSRIEPSSTANSHQPMYSAPSLAELSSSE